jgi:nicotinamide mononucleotide transporter
LVCKKDNILFFPTGLVSTSIFVYLLWKWTLWGDMMINGYYFVMSIYGWYHWTRKKEIQLSFQFQNFQRRKRIAIILLYFTVAFVVSVYHYFGKFTTWYAYVDTFITGIFFVGMWLMAEKSKTGYFDNWRCNFNSTIFFKRIYFY